MIRVGVVQFPGSNCEAETAAALRDAGAEPTVARWNTPRSAWEALDGFVLPGGFSYEDRIRAGAVAARHSVLDAIAAAIDAGKPVLGVCNGAQILVEAGLVPGIESGRVEVALARNRTAGWRGYFCGWVHVRVESTAAPEDIATGRVLPLSVGHGEGRFAAAPEVFLELARRRQIACRYVGATGEPARGFPENPNGSPQDIAALCDPSGMVVALMPHPERAAWMYQVPEETLGEWGDRRRAIQRATDLIAPGPGALLYRSFVQRAAAGRDR
jgi:phosphoribosylformylglycinamidine synthase